MQRRRLSRLARMAFSVGWPLAEGLERLPLVFVSRHGETPRTFDILSDLANDEPLSPTQFSLSVHNAVIGLWSILRGETSEMTALACAGDGLEHGVVEAAALLEEGAPAVLLVITEEQPPAAYAPWIDDVPFPYALGLLLTPGDQWQLSLTTRESGEPDSERSQWPHALCNIPGRIGYGTGNTTAEQKPRRLSLASAGHGPELCPVRCGRVVPACGRLPAAGAVAR
jgi:hypothetical protein